MSVLIDIYFIVFLQSCVRDLVSLSFKVKGVV